MHLEIVSAIDKPILLFLVINYYYYTQEHTLNPFSGI